VDLGEFACDCSVMKFVYGFLGEILSASDIDGFKPTFLSPAPGSAWSYTDLLQPFGQADNRHHRICFFLIHLVSQFRSN